MPPNLLWTLKCVPLLVESWNSLVKFENYADFKNSVHVLYYVAPKWRFAHTNFMAQPIPRVPIPPRHSSGICHVVGNGSGKFVKNLCLGVRHLSILLEAVNIVPFNISLYKYAYLSTYKCKAGQGGGEVRHAVGIWNFSKLFLQIPCSRAIHSSQMHKYFPTLGCTCLPLT